MHPRILAARAQQALAKLVAASQVISEQLGMTDLAETINLVSNKNPEIAAMQRLEYIADFVDSLAQSLRVVGPAQTDESVLARLEGLDLSKAALEKVRAEFGYVAPVEPAAPSAPVDATATTDATDAPVDATGSTDATDATDATGAAGAPE